MVAYVVFIVESVSDADAIKKYRSEGRSSLEKYKARFMAGPGVTEMLEGAPVDGTVMLQFDDLESARQWYFSAEYQAVIPIRQSGSQMRAFIVEGRG